jgi:hypothetical protein
MRLVRQGGVYECASDRGITVYFDSAARAPGRPRGGGWRAEVNRGGRAPLGHVAATREQAAGWARRHWRPNFLRGVMAGLGASPDAEALHRAAAGGDHEALVALLDLAEEAGAGPERGEVAGEALREHLFGRPPPAAAERWARREAARHRAAVVAMVAHESWSSRHWGLCEARREGLIVYYDNHPFADPHRRPRLLGLIREGLAGAGLEVLAEEGYPRRGEGAGYTVALAIGARPEQYALARSAVGAASREFWEELAESADTGGDGPASLPGTGDGAP